MAVEAGRNPIWVALDYDNLAQIEALLNQIAGDIGGVKVGLEAINSIGLPNLLMSLGMSKKLQDVRVFADVKTCDIPNTCGRATRAICKYGNVAYLNVMANAGVEAMKAVVRERGEANVLAVTVLTSLDDAACLLSYGAPIAETVARHALMAAEAGVQGLICSAQQLPLLRELPELKDMEYMCPGIRLPKAETHDQVQVTTPGAAMRAGATNLVIGRDITQADDPLEAIERIMADIYG